MARALTKTIKSVNIAIVRKTAGLGTHDEGYVFGQTNIITASANASIRVVSGTTADMTEPWTLKLVVPEQFRFRSTGTVATPAGAVDPAFYSSAMDSNGDEVVSFLANAEDTSGAISNGVVVTITWNAWDDTTLHATMFRVTCQSDVSGHSAAIKCRFTEDGALHTFDGASNRSKLHNGDTLSGPFSELEVDSVSNTDTTCFIYYQEH